MDLWEADREDRLQEVWSEDVTHLADLPYDPRRGHIWECLARQAQVFHPRLIDGRTSAEVADALGLTRELLGFRLHRMKRSPRDWFERPAALRLSHSEGGWPGNCQEKRILAQHVGILCE